MVYCICTVYLVLEPSHKQTCVHRTIIHVYCTVYCCIRSIRDWLGFYAEIQAVCWDSVQYSLPSTLILATHISFYTLKCCWR